MLFNCKKSCNQCHPDDSADVTMILKRTAQFGPTQIAEGSHKEETLEVVKSMLEYMESSPEFLSLPRKIKEVCKNKVCLFKNVVGPDNEPGLNLMKSFLFPRTTFVLFGLQ